MIMLSDISPLIYEVFEMKKIIVSIGKVLSYPRSRISTQHIMFIYLLSIITRWLRNNDFHDHTTIINFIITKIKMNLQKSNYYVSENMNISKHLV